MRRFEAWKAWHGSKMHQIFSYITHVSRNLCEEAIGPLSSYSRIWTWSLMRLVKCKSLLIGLLPLTKRVGRPLIMTKSSWNSWFDLPQLTYIVTSAVVGMFFPYRHVGIIWSRRRHACRHNSCFKIKWNTRRKTVKTKVSRVIHAYIISLP